MDNPLPLRPPHQVMQLERLGAFHQTRLSFVRSLIRQMGREKWRIEPARFDLDEDGFGTCIYRVEAAAGEVYSVVIFSQYLDDALRTDRVIAEQWDIACVLCEGIPDEHRLAELRQHVPKQEAGRNQADVLVLSRANKSGRNFQYVIDCLSQGKQPDPQYLTKVGYLVRTTAVYGNGKFGLADYVKLKRRHAFQRPFSAQMFTVYMIRHFSAELVQYIAQKQAPRTAVPLHPALRRYLGVGNATGLGMAPFLIKHPRLIHQWISARETALARILTQATITSEHFDQLQGLLDKTAVHFGETFTSDVQQSAKNAQVQREIPLIQDYLNEREVTEVDWSQLMAWAAQSLSLETQELLVSLLMELYPECVDDLENEMGVDETAVLQPEMSIQALKQEIINRYAWAIQIDFSNPKAQHYFWYRSAEKEEPRLGERLLEPGAEKEQHIGIGRSVASLYQQLLTLPDEQQSQSVIHFLLAYPQFKGIVRRIQSLTDCPYAEVQSNLIGAECLPIHLLRCKLSFFGASKFDPKSILWTRITLFQGAPLVADLSRPFRDDWCFPCAPSLAEN